MYEEIQKRNGTPGIFELSSNSLRRPRGGKAEELLKSRQSAPPRVRDYITVFGKWYLPVKNPFSGIFTPKDTSDWNTQSQSTFYKKHLNLGYQRRGNSLYSATKCLKGRYIFVFSKFERNVGRNTKKKWYHF